MFEPAIRSLTPGRRAAGHRDASKIRREGKARLQICVRFDDRTFKRITNIAYASNTTTSEVIRKLIERGMRA